MRIFTSIYNIIKLEWFKSIKVFSYSILFNPQIFMVAFMLQSMSSILCIFLKHVFQILNRNFKQSCLIFNSEIFDTKWNENFWLFFLILWDLGTNTQILFSWKTFYFLRRCLSLLDIENALVKLAITVPFLNVRISH